MSKVGKIALKSFLGLLLLVMLAALTLPKLINPNNYKSLIESSVHDATGYYFKISGPIEWQIFPSIALSLRDIQLSLDKEHAKPLAEVKTAAINLALKPLLTKQFIFNEIELYKPQINVIPELLALHVSDKPQNKANTVLQNEDHTAQSAGSSSIQIDIKKMTLKEGHITFWDRQGKSIELSDIELKTSQFSTEKATPISLHAHFAEQANALSGTFKLDVALQLGKPMWILKEMSGDVAIEKAEFLTRPLSVSLSIPSAEFNQQTGAINLPQLQVGIDDQAALSAAIKSQQVHNKLELEGNINLSQFDARKLISNFLPEAVTKLPRDAYKQVNLSVAINANEEQLSLTDLQASLDSSKLEGALVYFANNKQPRLDINIDVDQIDMDKYWLISSAPEKKDVGAPAVNTSTKSSSIETAGSQASRSSKKTFAEKLELSAEFKVNRFKFMNLVFGRVYGKVRSANGRYQLNPVSALMYEGRYRSSSVIDLNQQPVAWQSEQSLKNINVRDFFNDFNNTNIFSGYATVNAHLAGHLVDSDHFMQQLAGTTQFSLMNGYYEGADLSYLWSQARQVLGRDDSSPRQDTGKTKVADMRTNWLIEQGVASTSDLVIVNDNFFVSGEGQVALGKKQIKMNLSLHEAEEQYGDNGVKIEPKGSGLPITLTGPIESPKVKFDPKGLQKTVIKEAGGALINHLINSIDDSDDSNSKDHKPIVEDLLKGLFKH